MYYGSYIKLFCQARDQCFIKVGSSPFFDLHRGESVYFQSYTSYFVEVVDVLVTGRILVGAILHEAMLTASSQHSANLGKSVGLF
jgi:hypothetical protein